jgi:hypothetical protein
MTDPSQSALPPLPSPDFRLWWNSAAAAYKVNKPNIDEADVYTADQMRAYALAALAAQPQAEPSSATVPSDEQLYNSDEIMALNADMGLSLTQISKLARAVLALAAPAEVVAVDAPHSANFADLGIPDAPESWDEDQRDTWRRLQVAEHNKMQWRAYALKLRALAAPAVQEPMRASDPNCPNCPGSGVDGDAGDDGRTIEVACSCLSRPAAQSADAVDAKPPKGFDDAPVSYDCDAAWAWASGYESGWNERAALSQSAAAAKEAK